MESIDTPTLVARANRSRYWRRVLRPLVWWLGFVLILFGIRTHQKLSGQTRLTFSLEMENQSLLSIYPATPTFDGRTIESGQMIPIGWHTFTVSHPKAEPFTTNLFVWYGRRDFGQIHLKRAKGVLEVHVNPPADTLTIHGLEFDAILTNSIGTTTSVPTDDYVVEGYYRHSRQTRQIAVYTNSPARVFIEVKFGSLQLECNQSNASFQVLQPDGELLEGGEFPSTIRDVPTGDYKVVAWHHRNRQEQMLSVKVDATNDLAVQFLYGNAIIESEPPGAAVTSPDGHAWGSTPLRLDELPVGEWRFNLTRDGYEPVSISLEIVADQTSTFYTNLVSINYAKALKAARDYLAQADYDRALAAANTAFQVKPNDPDAMMVQREATGKGRLRRAEALGKQGDYIAGVKELELALKVLPENGEVVQLLADFKERMPAQIERLRVERLERPRKMFDSLMNRYSEARLFDEHEMKSTVPVKEVQNAIVRALKSQPAFSLVRNDSPTPETFEIEATQELTTYLNTSAGRRKCLIVGGRTKDDETVILFKVLEYKAEAVEKFSIGAWIGTPVNVNYVPIHPSGNAKLSEKLQAQLDGGTSNLTERIRNVINQAQ